MPDYITTESNYELPPAGLHAGVCVDYVDVGMKPTQFGEKHKIKYVFQIEEKNSKGYRYTVTAWFNRSLHENSTLRQFLEQWRGRPFKEAEINKPPGFDLESVIGVPCTINIVHNTKGEKTYANIASIALHTNKFGEALEPDNYVREEDREDKQQAAAAGAQAQSQPTEIDDDQIPF